MTKQQKYPLVILAEEARRACLSVYYSAPDELEERRRFRDDAVWCLMCEVGKWYGLKPRDFHREVNLPDFEFAFLYNLTSTEDDASCAAIRAMGHINEQAAQLKAFWDADQYRRYLEKAAGDRR